MAVLVKPASDKFNILIGSTKHEIASARARKRERLRLGRTSEFLLQVLVLDFKESRFAKVSFLLEYVVL